MTGFRRTACAILIGAALLGGRALLGDDAAPAKITGTVTYKEQVDLPPGALVRVRLEDASRPERPPKLVAAVTVAADGKQVPIAFELPYTAADIQPSGRYVVRAAILADGKTLFASKTPYAVLTRGAPRNLQILVQQAGRPPRSVQPAALAGTTWLLAELGGDPVVVPPEHTRARLVLDAGATTFHGSTGCNLISGTYELGVSALLLKAGAMTMMACPDDSIQEQAFLDALQATRGYRIAGGKLALLDGDRVLALLAPEPARAGAQSE